MLIITLIIVIVLMNELNTEKTNDSILFQRMATLLIYTLEDQEQQTRTSIQGLEEKYSIFCRLKDSAGSTVYQSRIAFPTETDILLERFDEQFGSQAEVLPGLSSADKKSLSAITRQDGLFEIKGTDNDLY